MRKIYLILILSLLSSNLIASTYTVVLEDNENNTAKVNVSDEVNLMDLINETSQQQIRIKSINVQHNHNIETTDAIKRGGGEGGEGG